MKITTKGQYSLKAMAVLAASEGQGPVSVTQLAAETDVSENYLEQLLPRLRQAGLIESIRGAQGGYLLSRPSGEISVGDVLRAGEGDLIPVECSLTSDKPCEKEGGCVIKYVWKRMMDSLNETVDGISLEELVNMKTETV